MDPLFPELPEDLSALGDEELADLLTEHQVALEKVETEDEDYIGGLTADEVLLGMEQGVTQIKAIKDEQSARAEAAEAYKQRKAELLAEARAGELAEEEAEEAVEEDEVVEEEAEVLASEEAAEEEAEVEEAATEEATVQDPVPVAAAAAPAPAPAPAPTPVPVVQPQARVYRRPAAPTPERQMPDERAPGTALVAASGVDGVTAGKVLDRISLAESMIESIKRRARPQKHEHGTEEKQLIAVAHYDFPPERTLHPNDIEGNNAKIRGIGNPFLGVEGQQALVASGGLCAPLTPLYDIPDFAVTDRPVRDALPSFQAERGGVSVPSVSYIADITTAITTIEEANDALGGTFATKSCQDLTCPTWTDVAVGIISHCREYGNMNARAWPEGIAHENNLTMAAHARTAEARLLDRIKTLSIAVTQAAIGAQLNAYASLVYAITRMQAGIRYRLRLERNVQFRVLAPEWVPDLLAADSSATQFTRYDAQEQMAAHLRSLGISIAWYKDTPSTGTSQGFAAETASAIDDFPDEVQMAFFVEGAFLHLDGGTLELGIVRDSTLNSTNDYQVFGETFENVARIGPTQGALWATVDVCPSGGMPSLVSGLTC